MRVVPAVALAGALAAAPAAAQTTGFDGVYTLTLTFGASCQARIPSVSIALSRARVGGRAGQRGRGSPHAVRRDPCRPDHAPALGHGRARSLLARGGLTERDEITSGEGWLFIPWLVLDGTVTTTADRPQARGTAFGFLAAGQPEEDYPSSLARCTGTDFSWALDPQ